MKQNQLSQTLFLVGASLTVIGSFLQLFKVSFAPYIFAVGVVLIIFLHGQNVFDKSKTDKREQRMARMGLIYSLFLGIGVYFMFTDSNSWVVTVLIYALSTFYLSYRNNSSSTK